MACVGILVNGVTEILKGLNILVAKEIGLARGVKGELQTLSKTLDMILVVLYAENKQVKSGGTNSWLEKLKDIAYEGEDILDECAYDIIRQRKENRVSNLFSASNSDMLVRKISFEIKIINKKFKKHASLKGISQSLEMLNLDPRSGPMDLDEISKLRELRETTNSNPSLNIIGRDIDKWSIIKMLLYNDLQNQDGNIQVIPIVGTGGLGKTTLAQYIYNDNNVTNHFELKMWVRVSDDLKGKKLFLKVIESITKDKCKNVSKIDDLIHQLQQRLSGKKYLLVLDDVRNKESEEWMKLKKHLRMGGSGSKIIVTTRSEEVASIMGDELHSYKLGILKENESWSLFHGQMFGYFSGAKMMESPSLTTIGKELVKKCEGLPLAIMYLIGLLRYKNENEWNIINKNELWNQPSSEEDETRILPVLKLSYDHLTCHLKQCFSYFSLFGKDYTFDRKTMISFWMAEGFLRGCNILMEEVGNEYFNSLLCDSLFQNVEKDEFGEVVSFKMHDVVHDLAKYVVDEDEYFVLHAEENMESIPCVRHLQLITFRHEINFEYNNPKLRTLLIKDESINKIANKVFDGTKRLRVLDFGTAMNIEEIPSSSLSSLKHLRYFDLSYTKITNLPMSVTRLFHLQTLKLNGCVNLKELPREIGKLINLRHLYLPNDIRLPREIGQLIGLQTLQLFNVYNKDGENARACGIEVLEKLNLLDGEIRINHLRNVINEKDAQRANLKRKKNLNKIYLNWHTDYSGSREDDGGEFNKDEVVLEALQPHPNLKLLAIDQYFGARFPRWLGDPSCLPNLVFLSLNHCIKCEQLVGFGRLPSLKKLLLLNMDGIKCLGSEFYGGGVGSSSSSSSSSNGGAAVSDLFPSLKELVLFKMGSLEEWVDIAPPTPTVANYSCFPCLEKIWIVDCPNLRTTPTRFPSLKQLVLSEINGMVAMPLTKANLDHLCIVELEKISELWFLPPRLLKGSNLRVPFK